MVPPPLKYKEFECTGKGLTYCGHRRANTLSLKNALGLTNRRHPKRRSKEWWEAQIKLYDLSNSGRTVESMKETLVGELNNAGRGGIPVPVELKQIEERLDEAYEMLVVAYREKSRVEEETRRMRTELEQERRQPMDRGHANLNHGKGTFDSMPPLQASDGQITSSPSVEEVEDASGNKFDSRESKQSLKEITEMHQRCLRRGDGGYISGQWKFVCPELQEFDPDIDNGHMTWQIHPPSSAEDCIWVYFDAISMKGYMRIEWNPRNWKGKELKFIWRGRAGESEIQYNDSSNHGTIIFQTTNECTGKFRCEYGGPWEFIGKKVEGKVSVTTPPIEKCQRGFGKLTLEKYEKESHRRWGHWIEDSDSDDGIERDFGSSVTPY